MVEIVTFLHSDKSRTINQENEGHFSCAILSEKFVISLKNLFLNSSEKL